MAEQTLQDKLDTLAQHIQEIEQRLKARQRFSAEHEATVSELRQRYRVLSEKVGKEVAEEEANGRHVSDLEQSIRQWLDSLELEMD